MSVYSRAGVEVVDSCLKVFCPTLDVKIAPACPCPSEVKYQGNKTGGAECLSQRGVTLVAGVGGAARGNAVADTESGQVFPPILREVGFSDDIDPLDCEGDLSSFHSQTMSKQSRKAT